MVTGVRKSFHSINAIGSAHGFSTRRTRPAGVSSTSASLRRFFLRLYPA
jgi:hypothetical protein